MIFIASDHGGWHQKQELVSWLQAKKIRVVDVGPAKRDPNDDYPLWAARLAKQVKRHPKSLGIALCRSGVGMALVANKFSGIRAAQAFTPSMAKQARSDEDANIISLASDYHSLTALKQMVTAWLVTPFRHQRRFERRLREIKKIEHGA